MCKFLVSNVIAIALAMAASPFIALAQDTASPKPASKASPFTSLLGEVTAIDPDGKQITLKPDTGAAAQVALDAKTHFMKIAPGEKDLKKASDVQFSEIGVGDRVLARVRKLEDGSVSPATTVVVMTKASLAQHHERNQAEWQTRGTVGTVSVVNPATREVTLKTQGAEGKQVVLEPSEKVNVRKYAPNSVKFSDAVPSSIGEIKVGDTIRVLGTKNEDGSRIVPEEIVYGTFVRQAGTIVAIDSAAGTVKMTDLATKKPVTVKVDSSTTLKKLPPMMAAMMANRQAGGRSGAPGASGPGGAPGAGRPGSEAGAPASAGSGPATPGPAAGGTRPGQGRPAGGPQSPGQGGGGGRRFDAARALDQMPSITLADLKAGEAIIVSSSGGGDPAMISAISLVAGVEPLLTAPGKAGQAGGPNTSWNFEMSIPQ